MGNINYLKNSFCRVCGEKKPLITIYCDNCGRRVAKNVANNRAKQRALENAVRY